VQKRGEDEATAAIDEQREETIEQFRRERYGDLVEAERKADGFSEDLDQRFHESCQLSLQASVPVGWAKAEA
jgi:hypothetical protein